MRIAIYGTQNSLKFSSSLLILYFCDKIWAHLAAFHSDFVSFSLRFFLYETDAEKNKSVTNT